MDGGVGGKKVGAVDSIVVMGFTLMLVGWMMVEREGLYRGMGLLGTFMTLYQWLGFMGILSCPMIRTLAKANLLAALASFFLGIPLFLSLIILVGSLLGLLILLPPMFRMSLDMMFLFVQRHRNL